MSICRPYCSCLLHTMGKSVKTIDLISVPLDLGVKELGLKVGPAAFHEVGLVEIARGTGIDVRDKGEVNIPTKASGLAACDQQENMIAACCTQVSHLVAESVREGRVPICLGGDHSLAIGSIGGVASVLDRVGCIWMDAHADANTPETSPSGNIHGMPVAIILGHGIQTLVAVPRQGAKISYDNMVLLGLRDVDDGEMSFLAETGVCAFSVFDLLERGLVNVIDSTIAHVNKNVEGVHVSLDLDVLHRNVAPGVGLRSGCGFNLREATYICREVASRCNVVSIDVVGLNPVRDRNMITARHAIQLLLALLGYDFNFSYHDYLKGQTL